MGVNCEYKHIRKIDCKSKLDVTNSESGLKLQVFMMDSVSR